jgi:hypothetical protein
LKHKGIFYELGEYYDTDQPDGVLFTVSTVNSKNDNFLEKLKQQLCYFDNIRFNINTGSYLDYNINDEFIIYRAENWQHSSFCKKKDMHIVLDQYVYDINWELLNLDRIPVPIGLRFKLDELEVTPNREEIIEDDDYIKKITDKIKTVVKEMVDKYNSLYYTSPFTDFNQFLRSYNNTERVFKFGNIFVNLHNIEQIIKLENYSVNVPRYKHYDNSDILFIYKNIASSYKSWAVKIISTQTFLSNTKVGNSFYNNTISKMVYFNRRIKKYEKDFLLNSEYNFLISIDLENYKKFLLNAITKETSLLNAEEKLNELLNYFFINIDDLKIPLP